MQDSLNYDGLKHFFLLSSNLSELNNLKAKSGSIATIVDTGAEYMYEESSNQWYLQPSKGGGVSEQWVENYVKAHAIESYSTLPSPQDVGNDKAIWDETGKRLLTPNVNEFTELVPAIRKVNEIVNNGNENIFYKKTGGIFYEGARVSYPLKNPVFYKDVSTVDPLLIFDWGIRFQETAITWEAVNHITIDMLVHLRYIAQCTHLDPKAVIWGGMDDSTWIYNSVQYSGATITDDELVYIDNFGLIREVTDNSKIGDLAQLTTEEKSNIVAAINEVKETGKAIVSEEPATPDYSRFVREVGGYKYDGNRIHNLKFYAITDAYKDTVQAKVDGLHYTGDPVVPWSEVTEAAIQALISGAQVEEVQTIEESDFIGAFNSSDEFFSFCTQDTKLTHSTDVIKYADTQGGYVVIPKSILAGAGLVFDGNTLKHSNSVTAKPQRYIRATAYDAQGHAINFGADYLVARTDNNDDAVSDSYLSSTLWVHVHHSPIEANVIKPVNYSTTSTDDCVFNFPIVDNSKGNTYAEQMFLATITSPISNTAENGTCRTIQAKNGNGNFYFEQYFSKVQQASYNNRIEYFRKGSIRNQTSVTMDNIVANKNLIQWQDWIPVEYPVTTFTSDNPDFNITSMSYYVSGGIVNIFINELSQLVASPASNIIATLPFCLKCKNGIGAHGTLINSDNFNSLATLSEIANNNTLMFRGGGTAGKYYGNLSYGIGY